jgi:hypothetical protein
MKRTAAPKGKEVFEKAVNNAAKSLAKLVRMGMVTDVDDKVIDKGFAYLRRVVDSVAQQTKARHQVSTAFTADMELPEEEVKAPEPKSDFAAHFKPGVRTPGARLRPIGRDATTKEPIFGEDDARDDAEGLTAKTDKTGGISEVGFVES